ncbi:MAG: anthranilate phosphoribosyltransferase, partial [Bifidobacterium longum]
ELAPTGPVSVWEIRDGKVTETEFDPTVDLGLAKITVDQLKGGVPDVNANAFKDFLAGKDITSRTTALLNAASAIVADGNLVGNGTLAERFAEAYKLAEDAVDSGKAEALFNKWIETAKSKA